MKIVALDYGQKRIGVAVAHSELGIPLPAEVLPNQIDTIVAWLQANGAECVVVGIPYRLRGGESQRAQEALQFVEALRARLSIPVDTIDERFTTQEAERRLREQGKSTRQQRPIKDALSAQLILETYLARRRNS